MYQWIVFLHIAATFGFVLAHGASAAAAFALRRERNQERVCALLTVSTSTVNVMYRSLLVLIASGITAGVMGHWWKRGWIWTSLAVLLTILVGMAFLGTRNYGKVRKAVGLEYFENGRPHPPVAPAPPGEIDALLSRTQPVLLTCIGYGGLLIILWLMMFKPF